MAAAAKARADDAVESPSALFGLGAQQRLLRLLLAVRDLGKVADRTLAPARCSRFVLTNAHGLPVSFNALLAARTPPQPLLEEFDLVIRMEGDDRLFPVRQLADAELVAAFFPLPHLRADLLHADIEQILHGGPGFLLARPQGDLEPIRCRPCERVGGL